MPDSYATLWTTLTHQFPLSMGFPRQEYWSGSQFSSPGDLPDPGIEPMSPALAGRFLPWGKPPNGPFTQTFTISIVFSSFLKVWLSLLSKKLPSAILRTGLPDMNSLSVIWVCLYCDFIPEGSSCWIWMLCWQSFPVSTLKILCHLLLVSIWFLIRNSQLF